MPEDYYDLLEINRDAQPSELKKAYRKQAMRYHPDRNADDPEAEERFKAVSQAYEVLSDENKRAIYDRYGHEGLENHGMGGGFSNVNDIFSSFGDLFGDLFGFGRSGVSRRGADLRLGIELSLEECFSGIERDLEIPRTVNCDGCEGTGANPGTQPDVCSTCRGHGQVAVNRGFISMTTTCPACRGRGQTIKDPCRKCQGEGLRVIHDTVSVKIPPGIDDGMKLRLSGKGEDGPPGGEAGDLYVIIRCLGHHQFERFGKDLRAEVEVGMVDAALGATLPYVGLDGEFKVTVKPGSQPNDVIRITGEGMPTLERHGGRGDLHLILRVQIPVTLSAEQRQLLEDFKGE